MYYYMDILPQDGPSEALPIAPPAPLLETHCLPIQAEGGAIDLDLAKLAEHPDVIRGLY